MYGLLLPEEVGLPKGSSMKQASTNTPNSFLPQSSPSSHMQIETRVWPPNPRPIHLHKPGKILAPNSPPLPSCSGSSLPHSTRSHGMAYLAYRHATESSHHQNNRSALLQRACPRIMPHTRTFKFRAGRLGMDGGQDHAAHSTRDAARSDVRQNRHTIALNSQIRDRKSGT